MQNRCDLMNGAEIFRNLSLFFRYIAWNIRMKNEWFVAFKCNEVKIYARLNLILQKLNPFFVESPRNRYYANTLSLFTFHCLHYIFCLISYISFLVLSFTQNHLQKTTDEHGFSTSSNLHSLHELYPENALHRYMFW